MTRPFFIEEVQPDGVAWVTLTRPDVHNAFNDVLIARLTRALEALAGDSRVRALVLAARGRSFSAGADLKWMQAMAGFDEARNQEDALALGQLMAILAGLPMPTLAMVQGPAYGGGVGLVACCDIAVAAEEGALRALGGEAWPDSGGHRALCGRRHGRAGSAALLPSPASAFRPGRRSARACCTRWSRPRSCPCGCACCSTGCWPAARGPKPKPRTWCAWRRRRRGTRAWSRRPPRRIARIRVSPEGQEGVAAFLEKRKPAWSPD